MFAITDVIKYVVILIIVSVIAYGAYYVTGLRAQLAVSEANVETLKEGIKSNQNLIETLKQDQESVRKANSALDKQVKKQNQDISKLRDKFESNANGSPRDVGKIAVASPSRLETIINNASNKALRCVEIASGAKLNEGETNEECSNLITTSK
jgi:septal ring factor EnvC (AmiA/AmiB activator)